MIPRTQRRPSKKAKATIPRVGALLAATMVLASCSLSATGQGSPTSESSSPETTQSSPSPVNDETYAPSPDPSESESSPAPSESSGDGDVCGGILSEAYLKEELSFTPKNDKYRYRNNRPEEGYAGRFTCDLYDAADNTNLYINYSNSSYVIDEATSDDAWQPLSIDGQEGQGWIRTNGSHLFETVWSYPNGNVLDIVFMVRSSGGSQRNFTTEQMSALAEKLVRDIPEHNATAGDVTEMRG